MALKRSSLEAMGLSEQQIQSVIDMHTDTVNALKEKIDAAESGKEASDKLKADYDKISADYSDLKERYKNRFLDGNIGVKETVDNSTPVEKEIIDIKEI